MLDRAAIAELIPHAGDMVLLDRVERWDAEGIVCTTDSHRRPGNPLARDGCVPAVCGIEYGGQAMALHGALTGGGRRQPGMIANVRGVVLSARTLDTDHPITVEAHCRAGGDEGVIYRFALRAGERELVSGQAMVRLLGGGERPR